MRCVFANATFTGGRAAARSHENRSRGVVLSCRVRWHMRGGMRVPCRHARAPQQREQRSRFLHWTLLLPLRADISGMIGPGRLPSLLTALVVVGVVGAALLGR